MEIKFPQWPGLILQAGNSVSKNVCKPLHIFNGKALSCVHAVSLPDPLSTNFWSAFHWDAGARLVTLEHHSHAELVWVMCVPLELRQTFDSSCHLVTWWAIPNYPCSQGLWGGHQISTLLLSLLAQCLTHLLTFPSGTWNLKEATKNTHQYVE